ncbi:hypothetical protein [Rhodococcoides fascians]|uniref:hypothetical protein n=1 Tax=Rhodococcoides fascians TaxID=1828 RepID=UPI00050BEF3E|nr:hypothetical protein [Rhodococcus fascians]
MIFLVALFAFLAALAFALWVDSPPVQRFIAASKVSSFGSALVYAVKGSTGGVIDMTGFFDADTPVFAPTTAPPPVFVVPPSEQFEAWTSCPGCGRYECHRMREPKELTPDDVAAYALQISKWHYGVTTTEPPDFLMESQFNVIRICECGREFGQK